MPAMSTHASGPLNQPEAEAIVGRESLALLARLSRPRGEQRGSRRRESEEAGQDCGALINITKHHVKFS
jgi:hypothetical protein